MSEELTVYIYYRMPELLLSNIFTNYKGLQAGNSDYICSWLVLNHVRFIRVSECVCEGHYEEVF